jgi:hypothetical protein
MEEKNTSQAIRAGASTYFLDIKETQAGKPYLAITESRFKGEGSPRQRVTIVVFPEYIEEFLKAITDISRNINGKE